MDSFSETYAEARGKFLAAATDARAVLHCYARDDLKGSEGERLACDVAVLGAADADRAALAVTGTHGIEGFAGSAVLHHGRTWHGSRDNRGVNPRRAVIAHCISSAATFHPTDISYIYSRYKKVGSVEMDESYFPVMWRDDGYRTPWLDAYVAGGRAAA